MNPILAALLTVFIVSAGLLVLYGAIAVAVAIDIALSNPTLSSREEASKEIDRRFLGKVGHALCPIAFWWLELALLIWHLFSREDEDDD